MESSLEIKGERLTPEQKEQAQTLALDCLISEFRKGVEGKKINVKVFQAARQIRYADSQEELRIGLEDLQNA